MHVLWHGLELPHMSDHRARTRFGVHDRERGVRVLAEQVRLHRRQVELLHRRLPDRKTAKRCRLLLACPNVRVRWRFVYLRWHKKLGELRLATFAGSACNTHYSKSAALGVGFKLDANWRTFGLARNRRV